MFSDISGGFFMLKTIHLLTIKLPYPSAINYGRYTVDIRLIHGRYTVYSYRKSILSPQPQRIRRVFLYSRTLFRPRRYSAVQ